MHSSLHTLNTCHHFARCSQSSLDIFLSMSQRSKSRLKLRRSKINTVLQHSPMKAAELRQIQLLRMIVIVNGARRKKQAKHPANLPAASRVSGFLSHFYQTVGQSFGCLTPPFVCS